MSNGSKILKWVLLSPVILVLLGIAFCEINKAYWDHKVKEWCENDGGVTVFEHIDLTLEEFKRLGGNAVGEIDIPMAGDKRKDSQFVYQSSIKILHENFPIVRRYEDSIAKPESGYIMSKRVIYGRSGGDFPTGFEQSSFSCIEMHTVNVRLIKSTVVVKG